MKRQGLRTGNTVDHIKLRVRSMGELHCGLLTTKGEEASNEIDSINKGVRFL